MSNRNREIDRYASRIKLTPAQIWDSAQLADPVTARIAQRMLRNGRENSRHREVTARNEVAARKSAMKRAQRDEYVCPDCDEIHRGECM